MEVIRPDPKFSLGALPSPVTAPVQALFLKTDPVIIPPRANFRDQVVAIRDQKSRGTCVGHACWGAVTALQSALYGWTPKNFTNLSVSAIYNRAKSIDGMPNVEGTFVYFASEVLRKWGTEREIDWPYIEDQVGPNIPANIRETTSYKVATYAQTAGVYGLRQTVSAFGPSVMVIAAPWGLYYPEAGGVVRYNPALTYVYGYHAVLVYGYDDDKREAYFANSWGTGWGNQGHGTFTYEWLDHFGYDVTGFVDDFQGKISGDLDGSSMINVLDAHIALQAATGSGTMTDQLRRIADVNSDAKINVADAIAILQKAVGI